MNNYRFLEMRVDKLGRKKMTQDELAKKLNIDRNRIQQLETSPKVIPKEDELRAYCEHFNTTSDYLLGIRKTRPVDENLAMISKVTGLSDISINILKQYEGLYLDILNYLIESNALFELTKTIVIDAPHDFLDNKKEELLSYGEYIVLRKIEEIMKQLFRNETLRDKVSKYKFERIKALYGNDPNEILKLPDLPED